MTTLQIPTDLEFDDLVEWLRGAGYTETFVLALRGDTHHTFTNVGPADGAPDIITIIESSYDDGVTVTPVWVARGVDDHTYDDDCACDECAEIRVEDAALRRVGM